MTDLIARLRSSLRTAMVARDMDAVSSLRSTLAAIENAGAVETDSRGVAIEEAPVGAGVTDVPRRVLKPAEVVAIVTVEAAEYESAASRYEDLGRSDEAAALLAKARILRDHLSEA